MGLYQLGIFCHSVKHKVILKRHSSWTNSAILLHCSNESTSIQRSHLPNEVRKVTSLSCSTDIVTENCPSSERSYRSRGLAWQYVKGNVFPVIFMSICKKEIRNWCPHSLPFISVSIMCTFCCRLMMQFSYKINCCFRQLSIFYDCKNISLLKMNVTLPMGWADIQHQSGV